MNIGNDNPESLYQLACIVCGKKNELHHKAHRNKANDITGFIVSCEACDLGNTEFGIWDTTTGKAII